MDGVCLGDTTPCPPCFTGQHQHPVPPAPPAPIAKCKLLHILGCFNDSHVKVLPFSSVAVHDHVTQGNCAAVCAQHKLSIAGIDQGNHCMCGTPNDLRMANATQLPEQICNESTWPCTGVCCSPHAKPGCKLGKCTGSVSEHCGNKGALLAYTYDCME